MKTLTSGDIAQYCDVNLRTVIRWLESGKLKGFKLPGRGNNRVLVSDFIEFLERHFRLMLQQHGEAMSWLRH